MTDSVDPRQAARVEAAADAYRKAFRDHTLTVLGDEDDPCYCDCGERLPNEDAGDRHQFLAAVTASLAAADAADTTEWGTRQPNGVGIKWESESRARQAAAIARSFDPPHPLVRRRVGPWETVDEPTATGEEVDA